MASNPSFPSKPHQSVDDIVAAILAGDYAKASQLANTALVLGLRHPLLYNARGLAYKHRGCFAKR